MGVLVAVGALGDIETSADHGASSTDRTSGVSEILRGVAAKPDGSLVVAVGDEGTVVTSDDSGATWDVQTGPNTTDYLFSVAWNGTYWVAVGTVLADSSSVAWRSTDAVTWTRHVISATVVSGLGSKVAVLGTTFYAAVGEVDALRVSTDGATWTLRSINPGSGGAVVPNVKVHVVASNGSRLMAVHRLSAPAAQFRTSTDGTTWSDAGVVGAIDVRALAGYGSGWVAVGNASNRRSVATATDTFAGSSAVDVVPLGWLDGVAWSGEKYVAVGTSDDAHTSATGASWATVDTPAGGTLLGICLVPGTAPTAPTLLSPANNAPVDFDEDQAFEGRFNDPDLPADRLTAVALKFTRTVPSPAAAKWWDGSAWQSSETFITQSSPIVVVPGGEIGTNGEAYAWLMTMKDAAGNASPNSSARTVVGSEPPTVTVDAPTGTVTDTTIPPTVVSYADAESAAQESIRVRTFTAAQYGAGGFNPATSAAVWDSGVIFTDAETVPRGVDLENGVTYRDYVQVAQVGGQTSGWEHTEFELDIVAPEPPSLTVQPQPQNGRVMLIAAGALDPYDAGTYVFQYRDAGDWLPLPGGSVTVPESETYAAYDYFVPPGVLRTYRVATVVALSEATQVRSAWSPEQSATLEIRSWWLKHPTLPDLNRAVEVEGPWDPTHGLTATTFDPIGSSSYVVHYDVPKGIRGTLGLTTIGATEAAAVDALLAATTAGLLLQSPMGGHWWIRPNGDIHETLVKGPALLRSWSIPFAEVASPIA
ncbi:MAG: WD40/YVTN/BNR-like repeat-containing protein [Acidimicrobiia bacterium]